MKSISGIYLIECLPNGRAYVGSSSNVGLRFKWHTQFLRKGKHHSLLLQRAWDKYGADAFSFRVVEVVDDLLWLRPREQAWINRLEATNPKKGFNTSYDAWNGYCHTPLLVARHRQAVRTAMQTPEMRSTLSAIQLQRFEDQTIRENFRASHNTLEARQNHSTAAYVRWGTEEVRQAYLEAAGNPELRSKRSAQFKALWADPAHRERMRQITEQKRKAKADALTPEAVEALKQKRREAKSAEQRRRRARQKLQPPE